MQKGRGTKWFIEGDISACFDKIDHFINSMKNIFFNNITHGGFVFIEMMNMIKEHVSRF